MTEKECINSPNGKHKYTLIKSGMNPVYGCKYCLVARPRTVMCPRCGYSVEVDEGNIWSHL